MRITSFLILEMIGLLMKETKITLDHGYFVIVSHLQVPARRSTMILSLGVHFFPKQGQSEMETHVECIPWFDSGNLQYIPSQEATQSGRIRLDL